MQQQCKNSDRLTYVPKKWNHGNSTKSCPQTDKQNSIIKPILSQIRAETKNVLMENKRDETPCMGVVKIKKKYMKNVIGGQVVQPLNPSSYTTAVSCSIF